MKKILLSLLSVVGFCVPSSSEQTKTVFSPFTGKLDYITKVDTNTITPGAGIDVSCSGGVCTVSATGSAAPNLEVLSGVARSSPTATIIHPSPQFLGAVSGSTITVTLNGSSVTLLGASPNLALLSGVLPYQVSLDTGVTNTLPYDRLNSTVAATTKEQTWSASQTLSSVTIKTGDLIGLTLQGDGSPNVGITLRGTSATQGETIQWSNSNFFYGTGGDSLTRPVGFYAVGLETGTMRNASLMLGVEQAVAPRGLTLPTTSYLSFRDVNGVTEYIRFRSSDTNFGNQTYRLPNSTGAVNTVLSIAGLNDQGEASLYWKTDDTGEQSIFKVSLSTGLLPGTTIPADFALVGTTLAFSSATIDALRITGLSAGECVQTTTGGELGTTGSACGSGSGGTFRVSLSTGLLSGTTIPAEFLLTGTTIQFSSASFTNARIDTLHGAGSGTTLVTIPHSLQIDTELAIGEARNGTEKFHVLGGPNIIEYTGVSQPKPLELVATAGGGTPFTAHALTLSASGGTFGSIPNRSININSGDIVIGPLTANKPLKLGSNKEVVSAAISLSSDTVGSLDFNSVTNTRTSSITVNDGSIETAFGVKASTGEFSTSLSVAGQDVCLADGTNCQASSGSASTLAVTTGTSSGFVGPPVSSPTAVVILNSDQFSGQLLGDATGYFSIKTGGIGSTEIEDGSISADDLGANSVGNSEMADDAIGPDEMSDADHGDVAWSGGVATVQNVSAANVAAGNLATGVTVASTRTFVFDAVSLQALESSFAVIESTSSGSIVYLVRSFDDTTREYANGFFTVPSNIDTGGTITIRLNGRPKTAASANTAWTLEHLPLTDSESTNGAYLTSNSGDLAVDSTPLDLDQLSWTMSVSSSTWAANDALFFRLSRNPGAGSDLTGDYYLKGLSIDVPIR